MFYGKTLFLNYRSMQMSFDSGLFFRYTFITCDKKN